MRQNIFISYSSADEAIADDVFQKLTGYLGSDERIFMSGRSIQPGQDWEHMIDDAIQDARVALFLISDSFRNSQYIPTEIRRVIVQSAADHRLAIRWLRLSEIEPPDELSSYDAFFKKTSLGRLDDGERDRHIDEVARHLVDLLGQDAGMRDAFEYQLGSLVQRNFGLRVRRRIARGDNSIVFRANGPGYLRAVKGRVLTTTDQDSDQRTEIIETRKSRIARLEHPAFIRFVDGMVDKGLQVFVEEYVSEVRPLSKHIQMHGKSAMPLDEVRQTLSTLAQALGEYHATGGIYGNIQAGDVFVPRGSGMEWKVRISAIRMSAVEHDLWHEGNLCLTRFNLKDLESFAPEQFRHPGPTQATDQYALALLGIEMLQGKPAVELRRIADIAVKEKFFRDPIAYPGSWKSRSPRITRILAQMLALDPANRYATLIDVVQALNVSNTLAEDNRKIAKQSYRRLLEQRQWLPVLADFYTHFLTARPDLRTLFDTAFPGETAISPTSPQIRKLGRAVLYLLNFAAGDLEEPTTLTEFREGHQAYGLRAADFDDFVTEFLAALARADERSEEVQAAWRDTISAGVDYMKGCAEAAASEKRAAG